MTKKRKIIHKEYLLSGPGDVPRPVNLEKIFQRHAPVEVEIGCGAGIFLSAAVPVHPEVNYIGIEKTLKYARLAAWRLDQIGCDNARVWHMDTRDVVKNVLLPSSVSAYHIYFPDPWFKNRHLRRRIFEVPFLKELKTTLLQGGKIFIKTDITNYYTQIKDSFAQIPEFKLLEEKNLRDMPRSDNIITTFEKKALNKGSPVYYLIYHCVLS